MPDPATAHARDRDILVTGDYVLDHHIYEGQRHHFADRRHRGVHEVTELGGAALVHYVLQELGGGVKSHLSVAIDEHRMPCQTGGSPRTDDTGSYAIWRPFDSISGKGPEDRVWRTRDAMGFGNGPDAADPDALTLRPISTAPQSPDVVVLCDGGMGFRGQKGLWSPDDVLDSARWIVLKSASPLCSGPLWDHLVERHRERLVVVVSSTDLRRSPARISSGLSWDATVESVIEAIAPDGDLRDLARCRHLIVVFGTAGGLWIDTRDAFAHLVYDADSIEEAGRVNEYGTAFGGLSCLTAAVAWHLALGGADPDLEEAVDGGLSGIADLVACGHGRASLPGAGFPADRLAGGIRSAACHYARAAFRTAHVTQPAGCPSSINGSAGPPCWSILQQALRQQGQICPEPANALARLVATRGPIALASLPHLAIGKLVTADRREIESLRILRQSMLDYRDRKVCKKPLSIGVFGPPGSGKSFSAKEIANALIGEEGWLEFNLSQFKSGTDDLIGAFHQIRDRVLRGQLPVAFFDEFDSRDYEWLQYLLAPMQDGAFQEGQITHPIGKCILIFAGGTSWTFGSFGPHERDGEAYRHFRMAKGPDFKSRLDAFLDVQGPNCSQIVEPADDGTCTRRPDPCDFYYPVRRAFMIRSELGCDAIDRLDIDGGLLAALLEVESYEHGSRSLSKVVEPLKAGRPGPLSRSLMAPRQQLALHVDADQFLTLARSAAAGNAAAHVLDDERLTAIAEAVHETWRALARSQGYLKPSNDVDFRHLSTFYHRSNVAAAERMLRTLALIGLGLEPGVASPEQEASVRLTIEYNLELLAEAEHRGWMEWYLDEGWQVGPKAPDQSLKDEPSVKTHPCIKPYAQLTAEERNKDRSTIRHYLDFARRAGLWIAPLTAEEPQ